jgi:hypothetical protein
MIEALKVKDDIQRGDISPGEITSVRGGRPDRSSPCCHAASGECEFVEWMCPESAQPPQSCGIKRAFKKYAENKTNEDTSKRGGRHVAALRQSPWLIDRGTSVDGRWDDRG